MKCKPSNPYHRTIHRKLAPDDRSEVSWSPPSFQARQQRDKGPQHIFLLHCVICGTLRIESGPKHSSNDLIFLNVKFEG